MACPVVNGNVCVVYDETSKYHVMQDIKTLLIVAMLMITICVVTYIIAECVKAVHRIENEIALAQKYAALAAAEATQAQEATKQSILGHLAPGEVTSRGIAGVRNAIQGLSDQLRGDR